MNQITRCEVLFYLFVGVGPYGVTTLDEINADEAAAAEAELNEPNGPMVLNADDMRLVIPRRKEKKIDFHSNQ